MGILQQKHLRDGTRTHDHIHRFLSPGTYSASVARDGYS